MNKNICNECNVRYKDHNFILTMAKKCTHLSYGLIHNQPERSKREDSQKCEMRCSEHCRNTVRDK